jgi:hypothetical protein
MFATLKSQCFSTTRLLEYAELNKRIPNFLFQKLLLPQNPEGFVPSYNFWTQLDLPC